MGVVSDNEVAPAPQPAVASGAPIAGASTSAAAIGPKRIPTTDRPTLKSRKIFGRKKLEVVEGKKITSSCCCHVSN